MDEEKKALELTGNDFIDAYNLGYEAGKRDKQSEVEAARRDTWKQFDKRNEAEHKLGKYWELVGALCRKPKTRKKVVGLMLELGIANDLKEVDGR